MAQKCVHKGCGKTFTDPEEECKYHRMLHHIICPSMLVKPS
jgi:hypothetical protein